jgi:hypothetical protein
MKRSFVAIAVAASLAGFAPGAPTAPAQAKSCSRGAHAVIGGQHKCLARGQYCAHGSDSTYHQYGFHCHKRDAQGSYHLT